MLGMYAEHYFEQIATGDESWFQYSSYSGSMFADSRESVVPRIRQDISGQQTMITIFFTRARLLVLEALSKGTKFNQDLLIMRYFQDCTMKRREFTQTRLLSVSVDMDNSMCHNCHKVCEKLAKRSIERAPHPPYSPDLSPCDFWLFGTQKHNMKD
jgi:hypothetical protein